MLKFPIVLWMVGSLGNQDSRLRDKKDKTEEQSKRGLFEIQIVRGRCQDVLWLPHTWTQRCTYTHKNTHQNRLRQTDIFESTEKIMQITTETLWLSHSTAFPLERWKLKAGKERNDSSQLRANSSFNHCLPMFYSEHVGGHLGIQKQMKSECLTGVDFTA